MQTANQSQRELAAMISRAVGTSLGEALSRSHRYEPSHRCRSEVRPMAIRTEFEITIMEVWNVSVVHGSFCVKLRIRARWMSPPQHAEEALKLGAGGLKQSWEPRWTPYFTIAHANSMRVECSAFAAAKDRASNVWITGDWTFNAEIKHAYDLSGFPFDIQDLDIIVRVENTDGPIELKSLSSLKGKGLQPSDESAPVLIETKGLELQDFFSLHDGATQSDNMNCAALFRHTHNSRDVHVVLLYQRNSRVYLLNSLLTLFGITSFSIFGWSISHQKVESRLSFNAILLLAIIAFKNILAVSAPPISYLTRLDVYAFVCLGFLSMSTAMHAIIGFLVNMCDANGFCTFFFSESDAESNDVLLFLLWTVAWAVANLLFAFEARWRVVRARKAFTIGHARLSWFHPVEVIPAEVERECYDVISIRSESGGSFRDLCGGSSRDLCGGSSRDIDDERSECDLPMVPVRRSSSREKPETRQSLLDPIEEMSCSPERCSASKKLTSRF